jgi:hypothetical protein
VKAGGEVKTDDERIGAVAAAVFTGQDDPDLVVEIVRHLSHDMTLDEAATMVSRSRGLTGQRMYAERAFLDRTRLHRMASDRLRERAPARAGKADGVWALSADDFLERHLDSYFYEEDGQATGGG